VTTTKDLAQTARLFHALSDATRLAVLEMLQSGERCVCELQDELDAAQSRLSFHLRVLKDAGLLLDRKEGRWVYYWLNPETFAELAETVGDLKPAKRSLAVRSGKVCCD
jgi:ArsR family transcriptional regulator